MIDRFFEAVQSDLERASASFEPVDMFLAGDGKLMERVIEGLALVLLFILIVKLRKTRAVREDGWFYLTPGLLAKFVFFGSLSIALAAFLGFIAALRTGYQPSWSLPTALELSPVIILIAGFGMAAAVSYAAYFKSKIRWNQTFLERITPRERLQIAWKDIQEVVDNKALIIKKVAIF